LEVRIHPKTPIFFIRINGFMVDFGALTSIGELIIGSYGFG
jgi:hypothetical protein